MLREILAFPAPLRGLKGALIPAPALGARIRRADNGVRIRFSDGRVTWFARDPHVSDTVFLASAADWARRHGAGSVEIEYE